MENNMTFPELIKDETEIIPNYCLINPDSNKILEKAADIYLKILNIVGDAISTANERYGISCPDAMALESTFNKDYFSIATNIEKEDDTSDSPVILRVKVELLQQLVKPNSNTMTCVNVIGVSHPDLPTLESLINSYKLICGQEDILTMTVKL